MTEYRAELSRRFQAKKEAALASGKPLPEVKDKYPNFSLVAGTELLEPLISSLQPIIHVYGIYFIFLIFLLFPFFLKIYYFNF